MIKFGLVALLTISGMLSGMASAVEADLDADVKAENVKREETTVRENAKAEPTVRTDTSVGAKVSVDPVAPAVSAGASVRTDNDDRSIRSKDSNDTSIRAGVSIGSDRSERLRDRDGRTYYERRDSNGRMYRTYEGTAQVNVYNDDSTIPVGYESREYTGHMHRHHRHHHYMEGDGCCNECDSYEYVNPYQTSVPDNKAHHGW